MITKTTSDEMAQLIHAIRSRISTRMTSDDVVSVDAQLAQLAGRLKNAPADPEISAMTPAEQAQADRTAQSTQPDLQTRRAAQAETTDRAAAAQRDRDRNYPTTTSPSPAEQAEPADTARRGHDRNFPTNPETPSPTDEERAADTRRAQHLQNP